MVGGNVLQHVIGTFLCLVFFALMSASNAQANQCSSYLAIHEILSAEGGVMTIDDEGGFRQLKATSYNIGECATSTNFATGKQFVGNYSLIGLTSPLGSGECATRAIAGRKVMESMQAIVIRTNGWMLEPHSIDLDDIDSEMKVPPNEAWMESAAAFGMALGEVILPKTSLSQDTLLTATEFIVPESAMSAMGLGLKERIVPGGEFSGMQLFNCPFGKENPESARCRIKLSFEVPVDTIVLLYGLKQQSLRQTDSAMFVSQIAMSCGCRCVSGSIGSRDVSLPIEGSEGLCRSIQTSTARTECDVLGKKWCSTEKSFAYKITGEQLPSGYFPCSAEASFSSRVLSEFSPSEDFMPAV